MRTLRVTEQQYAALRKRSPAKPPEMPAKALKSAPVPRKRVADLIPCEPVLAPVTVRATKYRSRATGGYASVKEARRAADLKLRLAAGGIRNLREQVKYVLIPAQEGERPCCYFADFVYEEHRPGLVSLGLAPKWVQVVEDVKSPATRTQAYVIKRKLMLQVHNIRVREV